MNFHFHHDEYYECIYQGTLPSSDLRYLNKALSLQIPIQETYIVTSSVVAPSYVAMCAACIEWHKSAGACITSLQVNIYTIGTF